MFEEIESEIQSKITEITNSQATWILTHNKYEQIQLTNEVNFDYSVTEYVRPNGNKGYEIDFYKSDGGNNYTRSHGFSQEGSARTRDWQELIEI